MQNSMQKSMIKKIVVRNNDFQHIQVLQSNRKKRFAGKEFVVEGVKNIKEAIKNKWIIKSFIYPEGLLSDWAKTTIASVHTDINYQLSKELMKELSGKDDTSELMAIVEMREVNINDINISDNPFIVLFDRPSNKGNLGTMIRSCDALGADLLITTGHCVDQYDPEVIGASMGSFFSLPVIHIAEEKELDNLIEIIKDKHSDFQMYGTTAHKENAVYDMDFSRPLMLMLGNETMGLSRAYKEKCDRLCSIPMSEYSTATSFNVGCAGSIMMYEVVRQRNSGVIQA